MAKKLNGSKWITRERRFAIYSRDGFACVYCGDASEDGCGLSLDHVLAREFGGTHESTNLVTSCVSCNSSKGKDGARKFFVRLRDKGVDTSTISRRIKAATRRTVDIEAGKRIVAARNA